MLRRSFDRASKKSALHMVSAWGCELGMVLAQIATDAKSNEITAVPQLLKILSLKNTIVTVDALNCQRAVAQQPCDSVFAYEAPVRILNGDSNRKAKDLVADPPPSDHYPRNVPTPRRGWPDASLPGLSSTVSRRVTMPVVHCPAVATSSRHRKRLAVPARF